MNVPDTTAMEKYFNLKIEALKEIINTRLDAQDKALELQAGKYDRHLANLNHEAEKLIDMQVTYVPRETCDSRYQRLVDDNKELKTFKDTMDGKASSKSVWISYLFTAIVLVLAIIDLVVR